MALIQWTDALSVRFDEIDQQHKKLIHMINDLSDAMAHGKGNDVLKPLISSLAAYTATHFAFEEKQFETYRYPDAIAHKREHRAFPDKVAAFQKDFDSGRLGLSLQVMTFLSDWLKTHIQGTDKKYVPFFQEKGLARAA